MSGRTEQRRYESTELPAGRALRGALLFLAVVGVLAALAIALGRWIWPAPPGQAATVEAPPVAGPAPQPEPEADLERMQTQARARLESYGWVDRERGIARIPVERAMELLVQRREGEAEP